MTAGRKSCAISNGDSDAETKLARFSKNKDIKSIMGNSANLDKERLLALYRQMVVIRRCEEQLAKSHQAGMKRMRF